MVEKFFSKILESIEPKEIIGSSEIKISSIVFDSRKANRNSVFVAQKGEKSDGHDYISSVFENGCRCIVCEHRPAEIPEKTCVVVVENSHWALGKLASSFYDFPSEKIKLIGVTGTNGKTTIATLLYRLIQKLGKKSGLFSTVANYINDEKIASTHTTPDAVTLNQMMSQMVDEGCEYCFMEVSSHSIVQHRIAGLEFSGGIFTNITHDHLDYHKTFENYINAKKIFFDDLPENAFAITNLDDKNGEKMLQNTKAKKITYSLRTLADSKGEIIESSFDGMLMRFDKIEAFMRFVGKFNASNLLAVYSVAKCLGFSQEEILLKMSELIPVDGRFETIHGENNITAIVDYAHTPDALTNVISTINDIRRDGQKLICVVGCGGDRDKTKRPKMAHEAAIGCDKLIITSDNPRTEKPMEIINNMLTGLTTEEKISTIVIEDRAEAIKVAVKIAEKGDIILVAGKGHETYQEIDGVRHHFDDREEVKKCFNSK